MLIDFAGIFLYLFSFLPAPVASMALGIISLCSLLLVIRFIITIKNMIPFL